MTRSWLLPTLIPTVVPTLVALAAAAAGCDNNNTIPVTDLNLTRPVDVAFGCYGQMHVAGDSDPTSATPTAMPTVACETLSPTTITRNTDDPNVAPVPNLPGPIAGQEGVQHASDGTSTDANPFWFAFILQSAAGTVALASWPSVPAELMPSGSSDFNGLFSVRDADPLTPGKNAISIGEEPVAIATDVSGCWAVTANAGSCDLSELNINSALDRLTNLDGTSTGQELAPVVLKRVPVQNQAGTAVLARPIAMFAQPGPSVGSMDAASAVGQVCPVTPTGIVYIAYPNCHIVAGIDISSGTSATIVSAIKFDAAGAASVLSGADLTNLSCPAECGDAAGTVPIDTASPRPVALDFRRDAVLGDRVAIGSVNSHSVTVVSLDAGFAPSGTGIANVALEDVKGNLGITGVALSPQIAAGGQFPEDATYPSTVQDDGSQGLKQYVYAVTTDGTVRVVDLTAPPPGLQQRECDTQIDGRFLRNTPALQLQCLPIGNASFPRLPGVKGPGIQLPGEVLANSVAIFKGRNVPPPVGVSTVTDYETYQPVSASTLVGYFAVIAGSDGNAYIANVDDDYAVDTFNQQRPFDTQPVLVMPHQLRDSFFSRKFGTADGLQKICAAIDPSTDDDGALGGGPRASTPPAQASPLNTLSSDLNGELPRLQQFSCQDADTNGVAGAVSSVSQVEFGAPMSIRDYTFPDLKAIQNEAWTLTYEGALSLDNGAVAIDGLPIRSGQIAVDSLGMKITDPAGPYCEMGVEPFDIVEIAGCNPSNGDGDCPAGYTCYVHPQSTVGIGACLLKSEAPRLTNACQDFLTTLRHYTVLKTEAGALTLAERKHELAMTPLDGCTSDDQCNQLAQLAFSINPSADPPSSSWSCQADPLRAPISTTNPDANKRCVEICTTEKPTPRLPCSAGSVCSPLVKDGIDGVCMEGVEPPQACVNGPQRYSVHASEAFTVIGGRSGYLHPIIKDPGSNACVRDPNVAATATLVGRIPLRGLPACTLAEPTPTDVPSAFGSGSFTGALSDGTFEADPCLIGEVSADPTTGVPQFDLQPAGVQACSTLPVTGGTPTTTTPGRRATAIRFRNTQMTLNLVDPYRVCTLAADQPPVRLPFVPAGYTLEFAQKAPYGPVTALLGIAGQANLVKVVRGPSESIWVVDDGDVLASVLGTVSSAGRVYRVESVNPGTSNVME